MNKRERHYIYRIFDAFREIPFPNGYGTSTASAQGLSAYVSDMRQARPLVQDALLALISPEKPGGLLIEDALKELDSWIAKRRGEDWR
jgi:hypothetical protein